jgi:hypothetical protein
MMRGACSACLLGMRPQKSRHERRCNARERLCRRNQTELSILSRVFECF